tara:strand:- start:135 stop:353 length:219 start_codon:yes stop_codon:yes gene_type:complete
VIINLLFFQILSINIFNFFVYIGPGMGGGLIALILGIITAFFIGLWGILYYPIKRILNKNNKKKRKRKSLKK